LWHFGKDESLANVAWVLFPQGQRSKKWLSYVTICNLIFDTSKRFTKKSPPQNHDVQAWNHIFSGMFDGFGFIYRVEKGACLTFAKNIQKPGVILGAVPSLPVSLG